MKKSIITPVLTLFFLAAISQDMSYEVRGKYKHPVKKESLADVSFIRDFIPYYPASWISEYISVEIAGTSNGKEIMAVSENDKLSSAQKNILRTADLNSEIIVTVHYKSKNAVTDKMERSKINISFTIVPEKEAAYIGGYQQMKNYLKENVINKITEPNQFVKLTTAASFQPVLKPAVIIFTVNEEGNIVNASISQTSGNAKTDKILMETILSMPKWRPAENAKGLKVKQEFEFIYGEPGC